MTIHLALNGILCALAIWFGAQYSVKARDCAIALFLGWLFYIWAWGPDGLNPRDLIHSGTGIKVKSPQLWAVSDTMLSIFIAISAMRQWWGFALWGLLTGQVVLHIMRVNQMLDFPLYSAILDKMFIIQIAIFLIIGWPNARNRIVYLASHLRRSHALRREGGG